MKITDFYSKKKIELKNDINMYVCGPTVYSDPHIGNMRPIIIFDILNRVASLKGNVNFVHNITDVDDKIINKAIELGVSESDVSEKYTNEYLFLLDKLNIKTPTHMPKVTENIEGIINFIDKLVNEGKAYEVNGSVYFNVKSYDGYGKLLNSNIDDLLDNEVNNDKINPQDFALWKKTDKGIKWDSPWGEGRPGWHTECSFFIDKYFGSEGIDIHGGGIDLQFPHHINEMAQFETHCNVCKTSKAWSYVGHINMGDEKMSKSLGNIVSAKDFIDEHGANTLKMIMLQTSILNPISLTDDVINNAKKIIDKIKNAIKKALLSLAFETEYTLNTIHPTAEFIELLEDDLQVSNAITLILNQVKEVNAGVVGNEDKLEELISNINLLGIHFEINYNEIKEQLRKAKMDADYEVLDKLREEIIK